MVTVQQVERGIINYAEQEIAVKATGFNKFAIYFIIPSINKKVESLISKAYENEITKQYFDADGNIYLENIYADAKRAIERSGKFEFMGIIFNETDVDKLYKYIGSA